MEERCWKRGVGREVGEKSRIEEWERGVGREEWGERSGGEEQRKEV